MNFEDECRHWKLSKILLSCFGLWPYQSRFSKRCSYLIFMTWGITCLIPMIQGLGDTTSTDIAIAFESFVALLSVFGGIVQCTSLHVRHKAVKSLYDRMRIDWESITDMEEKTILKEFSRKGQLLAIVFICFGTVGYVWFVCLTYVPLLFENQNATRDYSKICPYYSHRWIVDDNYRNLQGFVHASLGCFYAEWLFISVTTFYICNVKHICAMYAIVGLRLRKLLDSKEDSVLLVTKKMTKMENVKIKTRLMNVIREHKEVIESVHIISGIFDRMVFILQTGLLACLSMLIFDIIYHIENSMLLSLRIALMAILYGGYVFYVNYGGEQIIQYSSEIFMSTHYMPWYLMSKDSQKILLTFLQRSLKADKLDAGLLTLSLENFARIIKVSWSFACVLLSLQKKKYS